MSGDHNKYLWLDEYEAETQVAVRFTITSHGVTSTVSFAKSDESEWQEILDPIVKHIEAHWGYPFDLSRESSEGTTVGMWYPGKEDE